jgi:hypothetical protein
VAGCDAPASTHYYVKEPGAPAAAKEPAAPTGGLISQVGFLKNAFGSKPASDTGIMVSGIGSTVRSEPEYHPTTYKPSRIARTMPVLPPTKFRGPPEPGSSVNGCPTPRP